MAPVGTSHGRDMGCVARGSEPVVHGCADPAAPDRRLARSVMAGDQQHQAVAARDRLLQAPVDRRPRLVERHAVQVQNAIRLDVAAPQPFVPAPVEGLVSD